MKPIVYFSKEITPEKVLELVQMTGVTLPGQVAIKVHSGEKGNQNFLKPEFWKPVIDHVGGTVVECNTAYEGERNTTDRHKKLLDYHGWMRKALTWSLPFPTARSSKRTSWARIL